MLSINAVNQIFVVTCFLGLGLSLYTYTVELALEQNNDYVAMCDISEHMSCTKAFKSEFGKGFGLVAKFLGEDSFFNKPNCLLGIIGYSFLATLAQSNSYVTTIISLVASFISNLLSMYFAYILVFVLRDLCIVCVSIYFINFVSFLLLYTKLCLLKELEPKIKSN